MFDTRDLLGAMLGTGMGGRNPRMGGLGGMLGGGGGMPGGLGGILGGGGMPGGLGGMLGGGGLGGGGMGGLGGGGLGGMLGGGGMGGMGGMGRGGGMGGGLQGALIGMLGGVAMSALQRRMQERASAPQTEPEAKSGFGQRSATSDYRARPASPPPLPGSDPGEAAAMGGDEQAPELDEGRAQLLIRVMIAAANADMRIDDQERQRITGKLAEAGANDAAREFVEREMSRPMSIDEIAREANGPDLAAQAYAAALAAIDVDKAMERRFLQTLAQKLGLDDEIVGEIHDTLGHPRLAA
jgi:uncharacterized membrane protein YebE (DUF533 family)